MAGFIGVIDYGRGNLRSVSKALEHVGARVKVVQRPNQLKGAVGVVLPGVGAFGDAMQALHKVHFDVWLKDQASQGLPLLGVCLGLQAFCRDSDEFGKHKGLGLFDASVRHFPKGLKAPHMGWNQVNFDPACPLFKGVKAAAPFYFVHSYRAKMGRGKNLGLAGTCTYGKDTFVAALWRDQIFATQFHPEKSQQDGLQLYRNFLTLSLAHSRKKEKL